MNSLIAIQFAASNACFVVFAGARAGKPFTIQLQPYASTDSLPKAYTWYVPAFAVCLIFSDRV